MKAYLIARVSTEDQKDALPAQTHRLEDYAKPRFEDYQLIELRESAYKGNRDGFKKILLSLKAEPTMTAVVFDKVDRFTRDSSAEEVRSLQELCRDGKIELHFPSDNLVVTRDSPATDLMRLGLNMVLAKYYSDAISDNVRRKQQQMLREGQWLSKAPFGYRNVTLPDGKKWIEPHPIEAKAVKNIYEWYSTGVYSIRAIRGKLDKDYGLHLATSKVAVILKNPFYSGEMLIHGNRYPHNYKKLVSKTLISNLNETVKRPQTKTRKWGMRPYAYRGLVTCGECGCTITFETQKDKYVYGHCTLYKGKHYAPYIKEPEFEKSLLKAIDIVAVSNEDLDYVLSELKKIVDADKGKTLSDQIETTKEIKKYKKRLERLFDTYMDGDIDADTYKKKTEKYNQTIEKLKNPKDALELSIFERYTELSKLLKVAHNAKKLFKNGTIEEKGIIANSLLSNWTLEGKELRWKLKKPFKTMAFCNELSSWQG